MVLCSVLCDYLLEFYLVYDELIYWLKFVSNEEVECFFIEYGDLLQIGWLKLCWLCLLVDCGDWKIFVNYYDLKLNFIEFDCLYGQYQLGYGQKVEGYVISECLWLVGKLQLVVCDILFGFWQGEGQFIEEKVWKCFKLVVEVCNYSFVLYFVQCLLIFGNQGVLMVSVVQNFVQLSQIGCFSQCDYVIVDVVGFGLCCLVWQDLEKVFSLFDYYSLVLFFFSDEKVVIVCEIGFSLVKCFDLCVLLLMIQYDFGLCDNIVIEWCICLLLCLGCWDEVYVLICKLFQDFVVISCWCYWQVCSL